MEYIKLEDLDLSLKELRDIIEFIARKRRINNYQYMVNGELLKKAKM